MSHNNNDGRKPVVLQLLPELITGGVERGTVDIARALRKEGMGAVVVSAGGPMVQQVVSAGATHITLPVNSKNPIVLLLNVLRLYRVIKKYEVDILHARSRAPAWSAYFAARLAKCHFITTFHGVYSFKGEIKRRYNAIMAKGEKVIAVSEHIKHHIMAYYHRPEQDITVIHRGADTNYFNRRNITTQRINQVARQLSIQHDVPVILLPGRMTGWKGHDFLLDALKQMKRSDYACLFTGTDSRREMYRRRIEEKIQRYGLEDRVRVVPHMTDMPALLSQVDIVVSASIRPEAFGRVAIEAQAMERLVIATRHGGACETVLPGETGWLVEPGNVDEMVAALEEALSLDEAARQKIVLAARAHVEKYFSLATMQEKTLALYRDVMAS